MTLRDKTNSSISSNDDRNADTVIKLNQENEVETAKKGDNPEAADAGDNEAKDEIKQQHTTEGGAKNLDACDFETAILETGITYTGNVVIQLMRGQEATHQGFGKYNVLLIIATMPGFLGCVYTTSTISLILPSAECDLNLNNFDKGMLNAIIYIGMISCAFFWGFLSDTIGRKKLLVIAFLLDVLMSITAGFAQTFTFLITAKLFSGFISAGPLAMLMSYLAEFHASKYRASILVWTGMYSALGSILLPATAWLIIPQPIHIYLWGGQISLPSWRIFLLVSLMPSLTAAVLLSFFSESPKFLMTQGKDEEAMKVFKTMYRLNIGKPKDTYPVKSLLKEIKDDSEKKMHGKCAFWVGGGRHIAQLFRRPYVFNVIFLCVIMFGTLSGLNTVRLWTPQLFSTMLSTERSSGTQFSPTSVCELLIKNPPLNLQLHANSTQITDSVHCTAHVVEAKVYINSMIIGVIGTVGYLMSGYFVKFLGKKWLLIILYSIGGICCLSMYWSTSSDIMLALTSVFVTVASISATTVLSVGVDLFPTVSRTTAVSLTMMVGRSGAMIGNLAFPLLLDWNCTVLFYILAAIIFGSGALTLLLPKTKGAALK